MAKPSMYPHSSHWGAFHARWVDDVLHVEPHRGDPDPNRLIENFREAVRSPLRISAPMVRRGWLKKGPGRDVARGRDTYIEVSWDRALALVADELTRVRDTCGLESIFGGSYGWSSAGRFHHAQSQLHRFLNTTLGGYVYGVNTYSSGAAHVMLPHIFGHTMDEVARRNVTWEQIRQETEVVLAFGGLALKNSQVASGGVSAHVERRAIEAGAARGCRFISISPLRTDLPAEARGEWIGIEPGTDTALILALIHSLVIENLHDRDFIERYCSGWERFEQYVLGRREDGVVKDAMWASSICGVSADRIVELAHFLAGRRVVVVVAHALQRSEHGEQPVWAGVALAAVLGQIGLSGGGFAYALGSMGHYGRRRNAVPIPTLSQGRNSVTKYIPVARVSDMLHHPGDYYSYNGRKLQYPNIRLLYWAGGNPMHHHQDLKRLAAGFQRVDTFVVHESVWTATARMADIVLPCTLTLEREDIGAAPNDPLMIAMHRIVPPFAAARDDYSIFQDLATRLGREHDFGEGKSVRKWMADLYEPTRCALERLGLDAPMFDDFWQMGEMRLPQLEDDGGVLGAFRRDPVNNPLPTPSRKIQITSPEIESFGYRDCPGHPAWLPSTFPRTEDHPLWLVANQPDRRLHSQLDFGSFSQAGKKDGREVCTLHPDAAALRDVNDGDVVRIFNDVGACLAVARISDEVMLNVIRLPTGAWCTPWKSEDGEDMVCAAGNPNILTRDVGTSSLAQGCIGQLVAVQVEKFRGDPPSAYSTRPPISLDDSGEAL